MKRAVISLLILCSTFHMNKAFALNSKPLKQDKKADNSTQAVVKKKAMQTLVNQIEVYGRIAKPQTVFIIPGSDPRIDGIRIERRFFSDIFRDVEKSTLRKQKVKTQRNIDHLLW